ncbi:helix-turn-helix domain-containing protein [Enterobacter sp. 22452]|uniref:helix-turn-helix domain-containing protein n=1 Tax=Enterobacter TaxID=547 RepID=UPI003F87D5EC
MKPEEHIIHLIDKASDPTRVKTGRERQIISLLQYMEPMTVLLHEGVVAVYRNADHMLLSNTRAPMILGFNLMNDDNPDMYLQARGMIRYEILCRDEFRGIIEQQDLWQSLAWTSMYVSLRFLDYTFNSTSLPTYDLIKNNLEALMREPETLRMRTNACDYIQEKTLLSRSGIMKILGDLKKGGHIELNRGILINIHKLPARY